MIGRTLDRYRIDGKLGEGGMGVVYRATDPQLGRAVAIKVLPPEATADASRKQRFAQEARAASALNHPGIVTVYDVASDGGTDFIVMELVTGRTLDQILAGRGLGVVRALRYSVAIADALAKAHGAGIVHRDLKPSNVMVTEDDRIKILDFGLAKLFDEPDERAATQMMLTDRGSIVGTAAYMSPEQARGEKLDGRSDIFSFGSVLYEMLTGRRPFEADSKVGVLAKILNDDPPAPSSLVPVPTDVERAVLRCLRKDPARRFQTTADLKVALEDLIEDSAQLPRASMPVVPTPRWRRWAWLGLVPVLIAAAYLGWRAGPRVEDAPPLRAVPLLSLPGFTRSPSFSPDGSQIAFSWSGSDNSSPDIYVQQIGAGTPLRLTSTPANDYSPTWSPDGRWIAFLRGAGEGTPHELRLVPPLTGPERKLTDIRPRGFLRPVTLAWCPDSSCVVVTDSSGNAKPDALFVVSLDSGQKRQLTQPENPVLADTDPAISPDGRWLVFRRDNAPYTGELKLLPLRADMTADGELRTLTTVAIFAYGPSWLPDSTAIVFSGKGGLWRRSVTRDEAPQPLPFVGEDGVTPTVSSQLRGGTRRLAYVRSYIDINIWRADLPLSGRPAISPPLVAISSTRHDTTPAFSPDGRSLAITSTRSGENEVWRLDPLGANAVQLTSMGFNPGFPRWSPSGDTIAFQSNPEGSGDIIVVPAEGGKPRNLTSHPANDVFPSYSRDGRSIYFSSTRTAGIPTIWKMPASGGAAVQVTEGPGLMAIESRDGAHLFYTDNPGSFSPATLWRIPVGGGPAVKIAERVDATRFDVVEGGIYYTETTGKETRLQYFDFASQRTTTLSANLGPLGPGISAAPDGRSVFYARIDSTINDLMLVEDFR